MGVNPSLSYAWCGGSVLGFLFTIQLITGIILSSHYIPTTESAFSCMETFKREVPGGYFIRSLHANGPTFIFGVLFLHLARNMYYGGYLNVSVFLSGLLIMVVMMATAFLGYVLP
jgi:ubiquinol-cytochrome c reductase cytochrome b subunit